MRVICPGCSRKLLVKDDLAGKRIACPACGTAVVASPGGETMAGQPSAQLASLPSGGEIATLPPAVEVLPLAETIAPSLAPSAAEAGTIPPAAPPPSTAATGVNIPGYEVLGELGRGGMGVVYMARQRRANRLVALKMILSGVHAGSDELGRFQREAEALSAVAARLEPKEAAVACGQAAATLALAMSKTTDPDALETLADRITAVLRGVDPHEQRQRSAAVVSAVTLTPGSPFIPSGFLFLTPAVQPLSSRLSDQQLVDLRKQSVFVGDASEWSSTCSATATAGSLPLTRSSSSSQRNNGSASTSRPADGPEVPPLGQPKHR